MTNTTSSTPEADFCLVVGLAFSEPGAYAFEWAAEVAGRAPGGSVHLLHVLAGSPRGSSMRELAGHLRLYADEKLKAMGPPFTCLEIGVHVRAGEPVAELARFAGQIGADLIVLGSDRGRFFGWFTEPTFERLLPVAPCPVVVAGPRPPLAAPRDPVIEPPCTDCVRARVASRGATWWCARHAAHIGRAHRFSYRRELPLRSHDSAVTPTGIDMG